jgi:TolA-binding protein
VSLREPRCYLCPLAELLRDGRLDALERASMEQHLEGCADCHAAHRDLARLAELLRAPGHDGGAPRTPGPDVVADGPGAHSPRAAATRLDHRRGRMRLLQAAALLDTSTERTTFAGLSAVTIPTRVGWAMPVGAIAVATMTAVAALGAGRFRAPSATAPANGDGPAATTVLVSAREPASVSTPAPLTTPPPPTPVTLAPAHPAEPVAVRSSAPPAPAAVGRRAPLPVTPAGPGEQAASTPAPAPETFAAGVGSMAQGNFGEAIDRLGAFRKSHPDDLRSEDAAFLMIVALQRAGRRRDAVAAAREYLSLYPSGYRRTEAQSIVAHGE